MKSIYDSPLVLPMLAWIAAPLVAAWGLAVWRRTRARIGLVVAVFALEIALDAWLTGVYSPVHAPPALSWVVPVAFVILGDLRYFLLLVSDGGRRLDARRVLASVALAFVVPVTTQLARAASARVHDDEQVNYLVYELLFFALAIGVRIALAARPTASTSLARALTHFEILQYGLWSCADVLLLTGVEAGWGLRIVPNLLYYVAFLPYALFQRSRSPAPSS